jgi:hypothetical protein
LFCLTDFILILNLIIIIYLKNKIESKLQTSKSTPTSITTTTTPSLCNKQISLNPSIALSFTNLESKPKSFQGYKRSSKLNLKRSLLQSVTTNTTITNNKETKTNEKIYKLIDLFSESECVLNEFNKSTNLLEKTLLSETIVNMNATNSCFQNLSDQLNDLLEFISYKSETKTIPNDFFTCANLLSSTTSGGASSSSSSSFTSDSSLILIIERVEFVSNKLNEELVKLIKYCLNASLKDGLVLNNTPAAAAATKNQHSSFKTSPASIISIVDLLCLSFEASYSLFLFRVKFLHSQYELNKNKKKLNKLLKPNIKHQQATRFIYDTLIKLKQEFFKLIMIFLKSINFSASSLSAPKATTASSDAIINLSNSSTSYSTLKILNSIIDCFNHLIYLPCLNKKLEPDSILTVFYFSLIDNMHNVFNKNLNKFNKLLSQEEPEPDGVQDDDEDDCFSSEFDDDDEPCLFKLFYEKIIKYFGEIVYSLEFCENINLESNTNNTENSENNNSNLATNQQISIITTIVTDDNLSNRHLAQDFTSSEKSTKIPTMTSSKSQNDLLETTQTPLSNNDWKEKFNTNVNSNSCSSQSLNGKSTTKCVHLLQTQLLSNFIHFTHNYQLFSLLIQKNLNDEHEILKSCFENTHHKYCLCYKNFLSSFLILIDYQFNEKFISGANLCIENCFFSIISSYCLYSPDLNGKIGVIDETNSNTNNNNNNNNKDSFVILDESSNSSKVCKLNEKTNRFMFLLIIRCFNALVNLFTFETKNNKQDIDNTSAHAADTDEQRIKFYKSIKDDYRLKNFCCLYSLTDMQYEYFIKKNLTKMSLITPDDYKQNASRYEPNYLYSSLESLRHLFNSQIDKYFDLD